MYADSFRHTGKPAILIADNVFSDSMQLFFHSVFGTVDKRMYLSYENFRGFLPYFTKNFLSQHHSQSNPLIKFNYETCPFGETIVDKIVQAIGNGFDFLSETLPTLTCDYAPDEPKILVLDSKIYNLMNAESFWSKVHNKYLQENRNASPELREAFDRRYGIVPKA